jgi:predicted dehydrogenase
VNHPDHSAVSRRDVLKTSAVAASTLAAASMLNAHAAEDNTIRIALVGCGGRGTGAAENALNSKSAPTQLVAMADVFKDRLDRSHTITQKAFPKQTDVPADRLFLGFDAYKQAMDCLKPGDVVILATPPAFRWVHFGYAVSKGLNVFMEKPVTVDGPTSRRMLKLAEDSVSKNLKVGVGLMCRHCDARNELYKRIKDGELGDIVSLRAYRQQGPTGSATTGPKTDSNQSELEYQIRRFHAFLWLSGGAFSDFLIHNIDECCWMKDAWPIKARASGGRHYRGDKVDQNFDTYSVEYIFADGARLHLEGRTIDGCSQEFSSTAHGTKGCAVISAKDHWPARSKIYKGQRFDKGEIAWAFPENQEYNPYQREWDTLLDAIKNDKPYNEAKRGIEASIVTSMGRLAAHTGQVITFEQMLNHDHEFAPDLDKLKADSASPLQARDGKYPVPQPGILKNREYETQA